MYQNVQLIIHFQSTNPMKNETYTPTIADAAIKFPVGTVFNSTGGYKNRVVNLNDYFEECDGNIKLKEDDRSYVGEIWSKSQNKWAEIVSSPLIKESVINNFPIY